MRVQLFLCTTMFTLASAAALAARAKKRHPGPTRQVLVVAVTSRFAEVENWYGQSPEAAELARSLFDEVVYLNDLIDPVHPFSWHYHRSWSAHRSVWAARFGCTHVDELYVLSIQVPPALALAELFNDAEIHYFSDGLMAYSPTRIKLPVSVLRRVRSVHYAELLPGIKPLVLQEANPEYTPMNVRDALPFFEKLVAARPQRAAGSALFLGQSLAASNVMSIDDEAALYVRGMLQLAAHRQVSSVCFKPHGSATRSLTRKVADLFRAGTDKPLEVLDPYEPVELLLQRQKFDLVVGVFSTALFTARIMFDLPAFAHGVEEVLTVLYPFANGNRIPLVASDIYLPSLDELGRALSQDSDRSLADTARALSRPFSDHTAVMTKALLVVGHAMRPSLLGHREAEALALARDGSIPRVDMYLKEPIPPLKSTTDAPRPDGMLDAVARWSASVLLGERKAEKLLRNPEKFFADSQSPVIQQTGKMWVALYRALGSVKRSVRGEIPTA